MHKNVRNVKSLWLNLRWKKPKCNFCVISDQAINSYEINILAKRMSLPFYSKDVISITDTHNLR